MIHVAAGIADFMWLLTRAALSLVGQTLAGGLVLAAALGGIVLVGRWYRKRRKR